MSSLASLALLGLTMVAAEPVLRYKLDSCNSLEPQYVNENWQYPGGAMLGGADNEDVSLFDTPQRSRDRNPPFNIEIDFNQYRRGREYTVRIETSRYYEAFILQARGEDRLDGNATLVGMWTQIPPIAGYIHCLRKKKSAVADKGRPVLLGNLTFSWQAPPSDYGPIKFVASIVVGDKFFEVSTPAINFNAFPVPIRGCGRDMSCFRRCTTDPTCPPEESDFMVVMYLSRNNKEVIISMGGTVETWKPAKEEEDMENKDKTSTDKKNHVKGKGDEALPDRTMYDGQYVAVGFGHDKRNLHSLDIAACYLDGKNVRLGHYLLETKHSVPYIHRAELPLDGSDVDVMDGKTFIWCQYSRPVKPGTIWDLDLSQPMFQFFFSGFKNQSTIYMPEMGKIWESGMRRNFSEITNDISFVVKARSRSDATSPFTPILTIVLGLLFTIGS